MAKHWSDEYLQMDPSVVCTLADIQRARELLGDWSIGERRYSHHCPPESNGRGRPADRRIIRWRREAWSGRTRGGICPPWSR